VVGAVNFRGQRVVEGLAPQPSIFPSANGADQTQTQPHGRLVAPPDVQCERSSVGPASASAYRNDRAKFSSFDARSSSRASVSKT